MIIAEGTFNQARNVMHVAFKFGESVLQEVEFKDLSAQQIEIRTKRILYANNRAFITKKLGNWLKQRHWFFDQAHDVVRSKDAARLQILIGLYTNGGFFRMCERIAENRLIFESLKPSVNSKQFQSYQRNIIPILNFCSQMGGYDE